MKQALINEIQLLNPWLTDPTAVVFNEKAFLPRVQANFLLKKDWDNLVLLLTGPRQSGKTTLGKWISQRLIREKRFKQLLYLNCDLRSIREWLKSIAFVQEINQQFKLSQYILFIDEVQRLENAGLLLKAIADLQLPIKIMASGSSQLEIKSKVQEFLTGRHISSLILPLSWQELSKEFAVEPSIIYGCYPQIVQIEQKDFLLQQLYQTYINKDIIEILKIKKSDVMEKLINLLAHCSGQLVNYQQLATDCQVSIPTVQQYINILEKTYVLSKVTPFVGNKRQEITSNPVYYFIDNGFRNNSLNNFSLLENRTDKGLLIEGAVFQELLKFKAQHCKKFTIHYWRTKGGAEVDFVLRYDEGIIIPIEVKYQHFDRFKLSRGFRSFIQTYQPDYAFVISKDFYAQEEVDGCQVFCFPVLALKNLFERLENV